MANVSLTKHQEQFIHSTVKSGRYLSTSEVVREALRLLEEREHARVLRVEMLKHEIQDAIAQAERGETVDAEIVFSDLRKKLENLQRSKEKKSFQ